MQVKHMNSNMVVPVQGGIAQGEMAVRSANGHALFEQAVRDADEMTAALVPPGDRPFVVGGFLKSKALAHAQGFIAAYRTATEF